MKYEGFLQAEVESQELFQTLHWERKPPALGLGYVKHGPPWPREACYEGLLPPERKEKLSLDSSLVHWSWVDDHILQMEKVRLREGENC